MSRYGCAYLTAFRVVCPECGRVGQARWAPGKNRVRCLGCKLEFSTEGNTYRPVTAGMSEEERRERRRAASREYYRAHREECRRSNREYYAAHREQIAARRRERRLASLDEARQGPYSCIYGPWIQSLPYMGSHAWLVFLKLCERLEFDEHGNASAWYGRQEMAESLGLSERQVSEAVRQLTEKGALSVKSAGHKGHATVYNVMPGHPWPR